MTSAVVVIVATARAFGVFVTMSVGPKQECGREEE